MRLIRISCQAVPNEVFLHLASVSLVAEMRYRLAPIPRTLEMVVWEDLHLNREGISNESAVYQDFWRCAYRVRLALYIHKREPFRPLSSLSIEAAYDTTSQLRVQDAAVRKLLARRGVY